MNLRGPALQFDAPAPGARRGTAAAGSQESEAAFTLPTPPEDVARGPRAEAGMRRDGRPERDDAESRQARREARPDPGAPRREPGGATDAGDATAARRPAARESVKAQGDAQDEPVGAGHRAAAVASPEASAPAAEPARPQDEPASDATSTDSTLADSMLAQLGLPRPPTAAAATAGLPSHPGAGLAWTATGVPMGASLPASVTGTPVLPGVIALPGLPGIAPPGTAAASAPMPGLAGMSPNATPASGDARGLPLPPGIAMPLPATPAPDAFAALAALAGVRDAASAESLDTRTTDLGLPRTDAPLAATGVLLPTAPVRLGDGVAVVPLGTIALPANPADGFDDGFDQRITWMVDQRITQAEMRVSPEGLGPIEVRLQVDGHRVSAQFSAANADVRLALEAGMDRLRDLLGQRGMELAGAQVGSQGSPRDQGGRPRGQGTGGGLEPGEGTTVTVGPLLRARGLIDEYV